MKLPSLFTSCYNNIRVYLIGLTILYCLNLCLVNCEENGLARGLGENIDWKTLKNGLEEAEQTNKILMLIIHKSWCGACKKFRPMFSSSEDVQELSSNFVMVNVEDNDEPNEDKYKPDGGYVPRILFIGPDGNVLNDIFNKNGNPNYKYFYSDIASVIFAMKTALNMVPPLRSTEL